MRIHNLMKDLVIQKVDELFAHKEDWERRGFVVSQAVKLDVICYVLNRVTPYYVVSSRGIAHNETMEFPKKAQQMADIVKLVQEGMEQISKNRRQRGEGTFDLEKEGNFFNFPSIIGRVFNGSNFEPISGLDIGLYQDNSLVKVIDPNWQNPYHLVINTPGTFLFWPHPVKANQAGEERVFGFELRVDSLAFEPFHYYFELTIKSESQFNDFVNTTASFRTKDLYLFPRES